MEELIYCQKDIPKQQWKYGLRSSAATGCGWIAVHNALRLLGYPSDPQKLVKDFTWQVPVIQGNLGTLILSPALYLRRKGFLTNWTACNDRFDGFAKEYPVCILFYRWRDQWKLGAHFVALRFDGQNFVGYNTYTNSKGPDYYGPSLQKFLQKKKYFGSVLIGIRSRSKE